MKHATYSCSYSKLDCDYARWLLLAVIVGGALVVQEGGLDL